MHRAKPDQPPQVSVIVVAFGDTPGLVATVSSLLTSRGVAVDIIVVDNGSFEDLDRLSQIDGLTVVTAGGNNGFGAGCNLGAREAAGEFIAFINPDVVVEPDALCLLAQTAKGETVGIATASVRLMDEPHLTNSAGGAIHFLGLGWAEGYRQEATSHTGKGDHCVAAASGAAMVMLRSRFLELGGFTEKLFLYHEDAELSLRSWLRGWDVVLVVGAVVFHAYDFSRHPFKLGLLERNRLILVATCYSSRTLCMIAPALLAYELGITVLAIGQGWLGQKVSGWIWLMRNISWIRQQRRRVQQGRLAPDRTFTPYLAGHFTGAQVSMPTAVVLADRILGAFWKVVYRWV